MRSLTSTLLAEQKKASRAPYVKALFDDAWGDRPRARSTRFYTGAEPAGYVAACLAGDGSLVRARVEAGNVYVSRVATPGQGSTYSSWTTWWPARPRAWRCARRRRNGLIWLFYVHTDGVSIRLQESADNGASWSFDHHGRDGFGGRDVPGGVVPERRRWGAAGLE